MHAQAADVVHVCVLRLWDMVDEFIYQFQSFAQYRGKLAQKSPHELELLKKCDGVWDLQGVLHYLQGLIDKSGIVRELATDGEHSLPAEQLIGWSTVSMTP